MDDVKEKQSLVDSNRILYTPSGFARNSLLYLQETGKLTALQGHTSKRSDLKSYLCFVVLKGSGKLVYEQDTYELKWETVCGWTVRGTIVTVLMGRICGHCSGCIFMER